MGNGVKPALASRRLPNSIACDLDHLSILALWGFRPYLGFLLVLPQPPEALHREAAELLPQHRHSALGALRPSSFRMVERAYLAQGSTISELPSRKGFFSAVAAGRDTATCAAARGGGGEARSTGCGLGARGAGGATVEVEEGLGGRGTPETAALALASRGVGALFAGVAACTCASGAGVFSACLREASTNERTDNMPAMPARNRPPTIMIGRHGQGRTNDASSRAARSSRLGSSSSSASSDRGVPRRRRVVATGRGPVGFSAKSRSRLSSRNVW